jgi:phosphatidylserine/phosphatidylglycerophosphate/cardiolipin synthase-like enzyme
MRIDDSWATIGSCNLHTNSLCGHTELNASFWDPMVVRTLRYALLEEYLGLDAAHLDARSALRLYREIAGETRQRRDAGGQDWQGLAYRLDPETYGEC